MYREYEIDEKCAIEIYIQEFNHFFEKYDISISSMVCKECAYFDGELNDNTIICNWREK